MLEPDRMQWDDDRTRAVYDEVADTYADHFPDTAAEQPIDLAMIDHFASLVAGDRRVLDAGCGAGRLLPYLASRGLAPDGVDLSPEMVRRARHDHPGFEVRVGSMDALPIGDESYDGVVAWYSTIHGDDAALAAALREFRRVLRPEGLVILGFQGGDVVREVGDGYRARGHAVELLRWGRGLAAVREAVVAAGLVPVASMERDPIAPERDGPAFIIARRPSTCGE